MDTLSNILRVFLVSGEVLDVTLGLPQHHDAWNKWPKIPGGAWGVDDDDDDDDDANGSKKHGRPHLQIQVIQSLRGKIFCWCKDCKAWQICNGNEQHVYAHQLRVPKERNLPTYILLRVHQKFSERV